MKRKLLALFLVFILLLTACAPSPSASAASSTKPVYPKALGFDDYEGKRALREAYPVSDALRDSVGAFSARSASLALANTEENALYSPISLWFALAICAESAKGDTRAALLDALRLSGN